MTEGGQMNKEREEMIEKIAEMVWDEIQAGIQRHGYNDKLEETLATMGIDKKIAEHLFDNGIRPVGGFEIINNFDKNGLRNWKEPSTIKPKNYEQKGIK